MKKFFVLSVARISLPLSIRVHCLEKKLLSLKFEINLSYENYHIKSISFFGIPK